MLVGLRVCTWWEFQWFRQCTACTKALLQEVTPAIHSLLSAQSWWGRYEASACKDNYFTTLLYKRGCGELVAGEQEMSFSNSVMGEPSCTACCLCSCAFQVHCSTVKPASSS